MLQLGRGFSAAESTLPDGTEAALTASIGPRLFSRGKDVSRLRGGVRHAASIGPRLFSRGKVVDVRNIRESMACFNWAAAFQPRKVPYEVRLAIIKE